MTDYFIDYTNGLDTNDGTRRTTLNVDSTSDTTHITCAAISGLTIGAGSYVWVTGRSGSLVTSFAGTTLVLTTSISGLTANDKFDLITPYKTVQKYTGDARTAGDNGYLRTQADHVSAAADITTTTSSTPDASRISLIGCSTGDNTDFWHDGTTTRATITFSGNDYQFIASKDYWYYKNIKFYNGHDTNGVCYVNNCYNAYFYGCLFKNDTIAHHCVYAVYTIDATFDTCTFEGAANSGGTASATIGQGTAIFLNCTFNATTATTYGLGASGSQVTCYNCIWGNTNTYALYDIYAYYGGIVHLQNCKTYGTTAGLAYSSVFAEDYDQTYGQHRRYNGTLGNVTKNTSVVRSGGATSSALMEPSTRCGLMMPLKLFFHMPYGSEGFKIWCDAVSTTVTIYMRAYGTWGTLPTNAQLNIKAWYLTSASTAARAYSTASTQVLPDDTTWTAFTTTFTPGRAGWAYVNVYLMKYTASCGCYVDVKPLIT
jgi:hypothetical protein